MPGVVLCVHPLTPQFFAVCVVLSGGFINPLVGFSFWWGSATKATRKREEKKTIGSRQFSAITNYTFPRSQH